MSQNAATRAGSNEPHARLDGLSGEQDPAATAVSGPLGVLLTSASGASPADRINYRDRIAAFGLPAIAELRSWAEEDKHTAFAIRTIGRVAHLNRDLLPDALRALGQLHRPLRGTNRDDVEEQIAAILGGGWQDWYRRLNVVRQLRYETPHSLLSGIESMGRMVERVNNPHRRQTWCWNPVCHGTLDEARNEACDKCGWLVCQCGACRDPYYADGGTEQGSPCPREGHLLAHFPGRLPSGGAEAKRGG